MANIEHWTIVSAGLTGDDRRDLSLKTTSPHDGDLMPGDEVVVLPASQLKGAVALVADLYAMLHARGETDESIQAELDLIAAGHTTGGR